MKERRSFSISSPQTLPVSATCWRISCLRYWMFAFMPSGLVLYWTTNTVLSILQQWNINRRLPLKAKARN